MEGRRKMSERVTDCYEWLIDENADTARLVNRSGKQRDKWHSYWYSYNQKNLNESQNHHRIVRTSNGKIKDPFWQVGCEKARREKSNHHHQSNELFESVRGNDVDAWC